MGQFREGHRPWHLLNGEQHLPEQHQTHLFTNQAVGTTATEPVHHDQKGLAQGIHPGALGRLHQG